MRPIKRAIVAATTVLVAASVAAGYAVHNATPANQHPPAARPAVVIPPPAAVVAGVQAVHHAPTVPHERVAVAVPTAFRIKGAAFDIKANVCQLENVPPRPARRSGAHRVLGPQRVRQHVRWHELQAADVASLMANAPNRVVLITCALAGGADLDYNVVVYAYLVSSVAKR